jgi:hypothetical protein
MISSIDTDIIWDSSLDDSTFVKGLKQPKIKLNPMQELPKEDEEEGKDDSCLDVTADTGNKTGSENFTQEFTKLNAKPSSTTPVKLKEQKIKYGSFQ